MFYVPYGNRQALRNLRGVKGHEQSKKEFYKVRRNNAFTIIGGVTANIVVVGGILYLIFK